MPKRTWYEANKERVKERAREWAKSHPEQRKATCIKYNAAHKDVVNERSLKWYEANKERAKGNNRKWYEANKDLVKDRSLKWAKSHPEQAKEKARKWDKSHPEQGKSADHRRRAKIAGNGGSFSPTELQDKFAAHGNQCAHKSKPEYGPCDQTGKLQIDHIIPVTLGGTSDILNIQPLCPRHNIRKGNRFIG